MRYASLPFLVLLLLFATPPSIAAIDWSVYVLFWYTGSTDYQFCPASQATLRLRASDDTLGVYRIPFDVQPLTLARNPWALHTPPGAYDLVLSETDCTGNETESASILIRIGPNTLGIGITIVLTESPEGAYVARVRIDSEFAGDDVLSFVEGDAETARLTNRSEEPIRFCEASPRVDVEMDWGKHEVHADARARMYRIPTSTLVLDAGKSVELTSPVRVRKYYPRPAEKIRASKKTIRVPIAQIPARKLRLRNVQGMQEYPGCDYLVLDAPVAEHDQTYALPKPANEGSE